MNMSISAKKRVSKASKKHLSWAFCLTLCVWVSLCKIPLPDTHAFCLYYTYTPRNSWNFISEKTIKVPPGPNVPL